MSTSSVWNVVKRPLNMELLPVHQTPGPSACLQMHNMQFGRSLHRNGVKRLPNTGPLHVLPVHRLSPKHTRS